MNKNIEIVKEIVINEKFRMDEGIRKNLSISKLWEYRKIAAENKDSSSEFLNKMLRYEVENEEDADVIDAILNNPNFRMEEETRKVLINLGYWKYGELVAKDKETSSELLNHMLSIETEHLYSLHAMETILSNPNFKIEEKNKLF